MVDENGNDMEPQRVRRKLFIHLTGMSFPLQKYQTVNSNNNAFD